jgi:hypothetical protein
VARKDRERARKRHAIERARRESGDEPSRRDSEPDSDRRRSGSRPGGGQRGQGTQLKKMRIGDVDRRGREFKRNMVLHPRTAMFISLAVFALAIFGLIGAGRQWISYLSFAVGFLVWADSRTTWLQAGVGIAVAAVCFAYGALLFRYQVL